MKHIKTWILIIVLLLLLMIKFLPGKNIQENISEQIISSSNNSVIKIDISNYEEKKIRYLQKTDSEKYNISLLYIIIYDDMGSNLVSELEDGFKNRLNLFDEFMYKESLEKIVSKSDLRFVDIKDFGMKTLSYDKNIFDWISLLYTNFPIEDYNVFVFVPIYEVDWCSDGLSQGFNYKGEIFFCMEDFFNPNNPIENKGAVGLMTHKFLHGVGFNHQNQMYKQYPFIDWQMGLPETNILLHGNFRDFDHLFFDEHTLKVLGEIERNDFEKECLDKETFICESDNIFFCKDSWGPFCQDIDKDGIIDSEDDYVFSSPLEGSDSDNDGIVDKLDLCDWNNIEITGNNINLGKIRISSNYNSAKLSFNSDNFDIKKIILTPFEMIGGFIGFDEKKSKEIAYNEFSISSSDSIMWRIQVFYEFNKTDYFKSYYLTFSDIDADFFYEKEWYYFNRFGCDIPEKVDFSKKETYDVDLNGLPDSELFNWAKAIDDNYDWDNDGYSDLIDTLPTINGNCSNKFVKGVKDSDNDGFCDPGRFDFSGNTFVEDFEISMISDYNELSDLCPYISGNISGCRR